MYFQERLKPQVKIEVLTSHVPNVYINPYALTKMQVFVEGCNDEIGWLGTAYKEGNQIVINDVFLFDQEVHATTTEITPEGLSEFAEQLLTQPDGMDLWNNLKVWGHSHVRMQVSPSGQDNKQMETFAEGGHDWFIRIIANKNGDLKVDLYNYEDGIIYLDLPWEKMQTVEEESIMAQINALYAQLDNTYQEVLQAHQPILQEEMKVKVRKKQWGMSQQGGQTGYWQNGVFIPYRTNNSQSMNNGNLEKDTTTKKNEEGTGKKGGSVYDEEDLIETLKDAEYYVDLRDLYELSFCNSIQEVRAEMAELGYINFFTESDLRRLWNFGHEIAEGYMEGTIHLR